MEIPVEPTRSRGGWFAMIERRSGGGYEWIANLSLSITRHTGNFGLSVQWFDLSDATPLRTAFDYIA